MTINSPVDTENMGEFTGDTLIPEMGQTMLSVEPHKKNKNGIRLKGFIPP